MPEQQQTYRDRAKERRAKYGASEEADGPRTNKLKEKYLAAVAQQESQGLPEKRIDSSNVGNRMLQKMGWKQGLGLGKANQGRTNIVEVSEGKINNERREEGGCVSAGSEGTRYSPGLHRGRTVFSCLGCRRNTNGKRGQK